MRIEYARNFESPHHTGARTTRPARVRQAEELATLTTRAANIYAGGQPVGKATSIAFALHKSAQSAAAAFAQLGQSMATLSLQLHSALARAETADGLIGPTNRIRDLRYQAKRKGRPGWRALKISRSKATPAQITFEPSASDR